MKTNKGLKKRVKITGRGKILALGSGKERKLGKKTTARKNRLKSFREVAKEKSKRLRRMMNI